MKRSHLPLWIFILSTFFSLLIVQNLFEKQNFILTNFSDRTIGIAVINGIDIASRSVFFLKLVVIFGISFLSSTTSFSIIWRVAKKIVGLSKLKIDSNILFTLSTLSIFILVFHYINGAPIFVGVLKVFILILGLSVGVLLAKIIFKKDNLLQKLINNYNLLILSFIFPTIVFFIRWKVIQGSFIFTEKYLIYYPLLWGMYWLLLRIYFHSLPAKSFNKGVVSLLKASTISLLIPVSAPLSNELQYSFSGITNFSEKQFSIFSLGILLLTSLLVFVFNKSKKINYKYAKNLYLPIFIASITIFNLHTKFVEINYFDTFHHGENLISTEQLFLFGKIPFINLYPTHGISYMFSQVLYSLVNGYQAFAPWLWEWIPKVFEIVLLYFVITKISNSFFSAILITFLPIMGVFGGQAFVYGLNKSLPTTYYFAAFLVGLVLIKKIKTINFISMLSLWTSCLFMLAWRIDFGIACFISVFIIISTLILQKRDNSKEMLQSLRTVIKSLATSLFVVIIILLILSGIGSESLPKIIALILEFAKFQAQAQGLPQIAASYTPVAIFQYFILPSISVLYVLHYLFSVLIQNEKNTPNFKTLYIFIAIFSLVIFIRSFQRQTLAALGFNPYFFVFLLLSLPIYFSKKKNKISLLIFVCGLLIYQLIFPNSTMLLKPGQQVTFMNWDNKQSRVRVADGQYAKLIRFLNSNLSEKQTFVDLSSTPLLYVASNRKFVNFFIPNAYYTSEIIQKDVLNKIDKYFKIGEIPIVILKQPIDGANNIDGVPNEIRSYRIYEYIYKNYKPAGYVDGYMIWTANNFSLVDDDGLILELNINQKFNFAKLPYFWGKYDEYQAANNTKVIQTLINKATNIPTGESVMLQVNKGFDKEGGNYLHLKILADSPGTLTVSYGSESNSQITFDLMQSDKVEDYVIRISSQYLWYVDNIDSIRLASSVNPKIVEAYLRAGD